MQVDFSLTMNSTDDGIQQEDVAEFYSSSGIPWKLSLHEAKAVVDLKT